MGRLLPFLLSIAIFAAPITATSLSTAPEQFAGVASGVNSTVSRLGALVAIALIGAVVSLVFQAQVGHGVPLAKDQVEPALRAAMVLAAVLASASAVVVWLGGDDGESKA